MWPPLYFLTPLHLNVVVFTLFYLFNIFSIVKFARITLRVFCFLFFVIVPHKLPISFLSWKKQTPG